MKKADLVKYIQLIKSPGVGPITFKKLLQQYGSVEEALSFLSTKKEICSASSAQEEIMLAEINNVKLITLEDEEYPYNLKQLEDCPPLLYALGNTDILKNENMLAVVGARNASISACRLAANLSKEVASNGIVIVSGLARGIDSYAHSGALSAQGTTIAVLGTGIDVVYPKENDSLYKDVAKNGLILSEYPFHTQPQAQNFPRRNRIVSGLSKGVLVIEAGLKSGSLITANLALDQGRDVFAVPGAPYDGRTAGCNKLIKDGAVLVEQAKDVLENFNYSAIPEPISKSQKSKNANLFEYLLDKEENNSDIPKDDKYTKLLSLISENGEYVDDLIRNISLPAEEVLMMIVELELEDKVIRLPGNKIAKT